MKDCHDENRRWRMLSKELDFESSNFDSIKRLLDELAYDADEDYKWLLMSLLKRKAKIQKRTKVIPRNNVRYKNESESEKEDENTEEEEEEEEKVVEDPQYAMFLANLVEDGKAYKLKISKDDESPRFLVYEKPEESYDVEDNVNSSENQRVKRSVGEEVCRENKTSEHNAIVEFDQSIPEGSCYELLLESNKSSEYGAFQYAGKPLKYEENVASSSSDSDVEILDNVKEFNEVNKKALVPAKKTLKEKLIRMLEKPYRNKEYKVLSKYLFEKKPICRHLDLRGKAVSSVLTGMTKSLFDDSPISFQIMFKKYKNDRLKALNLLRMFRFWLVHVPNQDVFQPWEDRDILKVVPGPRTR